MSKVDVICGSSLIAFTLLCASMPFVSFRVANPIEPIAVESLRSAHVETSVLRLKATQFLGDAEAGVSGNELLYERLVVAAEKAYPDGDYVAHGGQVSRSVDGYKTHSRIAMAGHWYVVYRKGGAP